MIAKVVFPDDLKLSDVSPILKKKESSDEENHTPVSILSQTLETFERTR